MNPHYQRVALRAAHRCEYCHAPEVVFNAVFEVEHIIPSARGGPTLMTNLALACRSCNMHKGSRVESAQHAPLYHPRRDRWDDHFATAGSMIIGRTPAGLATIKCLGMNNAEAVNARRHWISAGLFP